MNTSDTQHVNKAHAAAGLSPAESQLLQSSLLAMAQGNSAASEPPALASTPTLTVLLQALKRRWHVALGLACLAATLMGLGVFTLMPPRYHASIRLRVAARVPGSEDIEFPIFKANMEALVKSPLVINNALNDKTDDGREVKDLEIVKSKGMAQITDTSAIEKIVDQVLAANAQAMTDYRGGKTKLFGFFVGQVMKASKGQANPEMVNQILLKKLG